MIPTPTDYIGLFQSKNKKKYHVRANDPTLQDVKLMNFNLKKC